MPGRTPPEAVHHFLGPLQKSFSCVTDAVLTVRGGYHAGELHAVSVGGPGYAELRGSRPLTLEAIHQYRIIEDTGIRGPWKVSTAGYIYELKDFEARRVLAYHWHPSDPGGPPFPHMHVGPGTGAENAFDKMHFPTGRIALEEVLRLLIADFGIEHQRDDWASVLEESQAAYEEWRTWPQPQPRP